MKRKAITTMLISVSLAIASFFLFDFNSKSELEHDVERYLISSGYDQKEITQIRVIRSKEGFEAGVIFSKSKSIEHFFIRDQKSNEIRKNGERFIQ
ncbi:hypothetical protein [Solibacillus sp. CAU 1738]|uniref:hypothetical protein n=1 Tax=Solibacillus sp. CAU 1738 TaxID=3140363 RepID=UPI0032602F07